VDEEEEEEEAEGDEEEDGDDGASNDGEFASVKGFGVWDVRGRCSQFLVLDGPVVPVAATLVQ